MQLKVSSIATALSHPHALGTRTAAILSDCFISCFGLFQFQSIACCSDSIRRPLLSKPGIGGSQSIESYADSVQRI